MHSEAVSNITLSSSASLRYAIRNKYAGNEYILFYFFKYYKTIETDFSLNLPLTEGPHIRFRMTFMCGSLAASGPDPDLSSFKLEKVRSIMDSSNMVI